MAEELGRPLVTVACKRWRRLACTVVTQRRFRLGGHLDMVDRHQAAGRGAGDVRQSDIGLVCGNSRIPAALHVLHGR
jgi:hypothetical protein